MFVLAALPALALAAAPPPTRAAVLLVPMDQAAEASVPKLTAYMEDAVAAFPSTLIKKNDELFGVPPNPEDEAALKRAEIGFQEGLIAFDSKSYDEAEKKLRDVLKEFPKAAGVLKACGHYCDAIAMFAATLKRRGDVEEARTLLMDLIALAPTYEISTKRFERDFISLRAQVATSRGAALRGSIRVKSKPEGGQVFVDGEPAGYTPLTVGPLPIGKHLVRIERAGHRVFGQVMDVTPEESELSALLTPTPGFKSFDSQFSKLSADLKSDKPGPSVATLGRGLSLDRAVIGLVKQIGESGATELLLNWVDFRGPTRVSVKKVTFQGDEYGQLQNEVARAVNQLLNAEGAERAAKKGGDPLDGKSGQEDWSGEDKGGKATAAEKARGKKKSGDPLDGVSGTEDW